MAVGLVSMVALLPQDAKAAEAPPTFITKWGNSTDGNGQFSNPQGVAVDSSGNVYVADSGNNLIQKFGDAATTPADATAPTVTSTIPNANATEVARTTNVTATFSEDMLASSINANTFKLFKKGSTTKLGADISYSASTRTATLDPTDSLQRGVTYKAVVTTGAKDLAGNSLDQNSTTTGSQQMAWFFTVSQ